MIFVKALLAIVLVRAIVTINCQDIQCETPDLCIKTILDDTSKIQSNCPYAHILFRNMTRRHLLPGTFRMCANTQILDLSNNEIKTIKSGAFLGLNVLKQLYISDNDIERIEPGTFHTLNLLEVFVFTGNKITTFPDYEFTSKNIIQFNVNNNKIKNLSANALIMSKQVKFLDLSVNDLRSIGKHTLINLVPGVNIILNNNKLQNISYHFNTSDLEESSVLQVSGNLLEELRNETLGDFYKLNLITLDLSFNYINRIEPATFNKFGTLTSLFLSHNQLNYIHPTTFKVLKNLNLLDLSFNRLTSKVFNLILPDTIKALNYSNNEIKIMSDYNWVSHTDKRDITLNLNNNYLKYIDSHRFCSYIRKVYLNNNNWGCSFLYGLIKNLESRYVTVASGVEFNRDNVNGIPCTMDVSKLDLESTFKIKKKRPTNSSVKTNEINNAKMFASNLSNLGNSTKCAFNVLNVLFAYITYLFS